MAKIRWLGHAGFEVRLMDRIILVDPWLEGNLKAACKAADIVVADIVCVTHDHPDHLGDAFEICKRTGASFVGTYELGLHAQENGVEETVGINIGGTADVKGLRITMVQAFHTASRGAPAGFVLQGEGKSVYHAGDTGLFGDMGLIGELYNPDVALLPIGGYYTMGPLEAAEAVRLIRPRVAIPMHYQTLPVQSSSADEFIALVKEKAPEVKVVALKPGETYEF